VLPFVFTLNREGFPLEVRKIMDANWVAEHGYTQPAPTYPWMWLWDSCFHAIIYAELGDERAVLEASSVFRWQTDDGMVPHMGYQRDPAYGRRAWRSRGGSTITQPPMYGHALRELHVRGYDISELIEPATSGIRFLLRERRLPSGLVGVVHPWETGADDSPRWIPWCADGPSSRSWRAVKDRLVSSLTINRYGSALANPGFAVAPASFNALVAFNAMELSAVSHDRSLRAEAIELVNVLDRQFDEERDTWSDSAPDGSVTSSTRTLDALLPALVSSNTARVERVLELTQRISDYGAPYGPCGTNFFEPTFEPDGYWRGAAWPQLTYLLNVAATRSDSKAVSAALRRSAHDGAIRSDFSEYHNPFSGVGRGARPHSWACLPIAMR
jgi:hypothetical protein